ncbi:MAG TPA: hypothetical protein VGC70_01400 [Burkholderiales bacterium]|jgi:hypothetical protein
MKRANHGTKLQGTPQETPSEPPAPPTGKNPKDAREDDTKLAENQQELGVGDDHKTEDMEEGGRGTFP